MANIMREACDLDRTAAGDELLMYSNTLYRRFERTPKDSDGYLASYVLAYRYTCALALKLQLGHASQESVLEALKRRENNLARAVGATGKAAVSLFGRELAFAAAVRVWFEDYLNEEFREEGADE